jgi:hypothetical protein
MRFAGVVSTLAVLAGALIPTLAWGQYEPENPNRLGLRLGVFRPLGSQDRAIAGQTWYTEEVTYTLKFDKSQHPTVEALGGLAEAGGASDGKMLYVNASRFWWKDTRKEGAAFYAGAGAGAYKLTLFSQSKLQVGVHLFAGYQIKDMYFIEARALVLPSWQRNDLGGSPSINLTGISLNIGGRKLF